MPQKPKHKKVDAKIEEILQRPMRLDFIPEYKENLKYMVLWTLGELRNTVYGDEEAMDCLTEIIKKSGL